jgi:hypothetical protein
MNNDFAPEASYTVPLMKVPRTLLLTTLPLLAAVPTAHAGAALVHPASPDAPAAPSASGTDARSLESSLLLAAPTIRPEALRAALSAWGALYFRGEISRPVLTVIDYGLPSTVKRMWVLDLTMRRLLFNELVAHGRNSGDDLARSFSNKEGSLKTSLGAFVTGTTYSGKNGYSLRLRGMEPGVNDRAEARTIVLHGAPYVGEEFARRQGRLGRSYGCPAVSPAIAGALIDVIKNRTLLYAWHPSLEQAETPDGLAHTVAVLGLLDALSRPSS